MDTAAMVVTRPVWTPEQTEEGAQPQNIAARTAAACPVEKAGIVGATGMGVRVTRTARLTCPQRVMELVDARRP